MSSQQSQQALPNEVVELVESLWNEHLLLEDLTVDDVNLLIEFFGNSWMRELSRLGYLPEAEGVEYDSE